MNRAGGIRRSRFNLFVIPERKIFPVLFFSLQVQGANFGIHPTGNTGFDLDIFSEGAACNLVGHLVSPCFVPTPYHN